MLKYKFVPMAILACAFLMFGCSGNTGDPVSPPEDNIEFVNQAMENESGRLLMGLWTIDKSPGSLDFKLQPIRTALIHYDITDWLLPPNCDDCLEITINSWNPGTHILDTENFLIQIPTPPNWGVITFAIDVSWPSNCGEPYAISAPTLTDDLYECVGSAAEMKISVYDWQEDVVAVTLEAPELTGEPSTPFVQLYTNTWTAVITNSTGLAAGEYQSRLTAKSNNTGTNTLYTYVNIEILSATPSSIETIDPDFAYQGNYVSGVTIQGNGFAGQDVDIILTMMGEADIPGLNETYIDNSTIQCDFDIPPYAALGLYDLELIDACGEFTTAPQAFEVLFCPEVQVDSIDPPKGKKGYWIDDVTIAGAGFTGPDMHVNISRDGEPDIVGYYIEPVSDSLLACDLDIPQNASPGLYDVKVINNCGSSAILQDAFEVLDTPVPNPVAIGPPDLSISPNGLGIVGNYGYVSSGLRQLVIFDLTDPANPVWFDQLDLSSYAQGIFVDGGYAYVNCYLEFYIIDISTPGTAVIVSVVDHQEFAGAPVVSNGYAYLLGRYDGIAVIDIDPPESAYLADVFEFSVGGQAAISGNFLYSGAGNSGIDVYDISIPTDPSFVQNLDLNGYVYDIDLVDDTLFAAVSAAGIALVDISTPPSISLVKYIDTPFDAERTSVDGGYMYVGGRHHSGPGPTFCIIDIDPIDSPVTVYTAEFGYFIRDIDIAFGHAYISQSIHGLRTLDVEPPENATEVHHLRAHSQIMDITAAGGNAYTLDDSAGFSVLDASPPEDTHILQQLDVGIDSYIDGSITVSGDIAIVCDYGYEVDIIDISIPESANVVSTIDVTGHSAGSHIKGDTAYIVTSSSIHIVDISSPADPQILNTIPGAGGIDIFVRDGYAYVPERMGKFKIIDMDPIEDAYIVRTVVTQGELTAVDVSGEYAFLAGYSDHQGLRIIDIDPPEDAFIYDTILLDYVMDVEVAGGYAYVADGWYGLVILDLDPMETVHVEVIHPWNMDALAVKIDGNLAFMSGWGGMEIYRLWD